MLPIQGNAHWHAYVSVQLQVKKWKHIWGKLVDNPLTSFLKEMESLQEFVLQLWTQEGAELQKTSYPR